MATCLGRYDKDPDATLDYRWDWSPWLEDGETLAAADVFVADGDVVIDETVRTSEDVTAWISGGTDRTAAELTCRVTTSLGRIDDRSIKIRVRNR